MLPTQTFNSWKFNRQRKTKRFKASILYYSNSTASYQVLIRSGDISLNSSSGKCGSGIQSAGSKQRTSGIAQSVTESLKCDNCDQTIRKNQKSVKCEVCFGQQHIKFTELSVTWTWTCPKCLLSILSFFNCQRLDTLEECIMLLMLSHPSDQSNPLPYYPSPKPLQADPDRLNMFFLSTNERTLGTKPDKRSDLIDLMNSFSECQCPRTLHPFNLRCVSLMEVEKEIDNLRSDTSTGIDQIPVKFVKLVKVHISGPLTHN